MKLPLHLAALLVAATSVAAQASAASPEPEQVLADASRYTVKVQVLNEIGLSTDGGGSGMGTGFLIDKERGWIITNAHVATRSPSIIKVSFKGGSQTPVKRIHVDPFVDLAVLEIPKSQIPQSAIEAQLSCDSVPQPGSAVFAYGHPWGLSFTASRGIVSGVSWFYPSEFIQTDAVINSGNSGGPLIRISDGKVIGLSLATYNGEDDDDGTAVSLAEPIPPICKIISLLRSGKEPSLRLIPAGIATSGDDLRPRVAQLFQEGLSLLPGDIILQVNGTGPVRSYADLVGRLRGVEGDVLLTVDRNGEELEVTAPTQAFPDPLAAHAINLSGLVISEPWLFDDALQNPARSLVVHDIDWNDEAGLTDAAPMDAVESVDGKTFSTIQELYSHLTKLPEDANVEIILRSSTEARQFHYEYKHIELPRTKLEWLSVQ